MEKCKFNGLNSDGKVTCAKGWAFQMLDQITDLAPRFRMPFSIGPISLSILSEDQEGAAIIFEKGIKAFPHDWQILYKASYFYLYEKKDPLKAAHLLLEAEKSGGPDWLPLLASKLYSRNGQLALGISTLSHYVKQVRDPLIKKRVENRLARFICERDALEQGKSEAGCAKESSD